MLLKCLKEEKLVFGITAYVKKNLGRRFVESPMISLPEMYFSLFPPSKIHKNRLRNLTIKHLDLDFEIHLKRHP